MRGLFFSVLLLRSSASGDFLKENQNFFVEDLEVDENCELSAKVGDHLLFEYSFSYANGTDFQNIVSSARKPDQLFHLILDGSGNSDIHAGLKGMCLNSTRLFIWPQIDGVNLFPLVQPDLHQLIAPHTNIRLNVTLQEITEPKDYAIFDAFRAGNYSRVIDMIVEGNGVNAFDEWGHTPLMLATQNDAMQVIAALLNARRPKVDVNLSKSSGYTALFYATELKSTVIMQALLRKGADPNAVILQEGSRGNTPLHFACMLEKPKHAELLLNYGASPWSVNQYRVNAFQLIPKDAVRSTKLEFKRIFEDAYRNIKTPSGVSMNYDDRRNHGSSLDL